MLYYLHLWAEQVPGLNVFRYVTFRALGASLTALLVCWIVGPWLIEKLRCLKAGQPLRGQEEVRELAHLHSGKKGTPTMGGLLIIFAMLVSTLLWVRLDNKLVWLSLGSLLFFGALGFADDYLKVKRKKAAGLPGRYKLIGQGLLAAVVGVVLLTDPVTAKVAERIHFPFFKGLEIVLTGWAWVTILFFAVVIAGSSNAVNLTDGLDGLAAGCMLSVTLAYGVLCYAAGHLEIANYLFVPHVRGAAELAVFCAGLVGACLGFLWYNCHPAKIFMGDTGSLALGGTLGVVAICINQEILLILAGGIFVIEALSVILQVGSFKLTGKRIFAMAPLHHHFELKGWGETTVTIRFWILSLLFALLALATLKLR
jgi:phospho-N-acetylmuramoyl-pentapeptide-transferase